RTGKLAMGQVRLEAVQEGHIEAGAVGTAKERIELQQGIATDKAREIVKIVKGSKLKVQVAIQGDQLRVTGKKRDDLQAAMQLIRQTDLGIAWQTTNFRD